MKIVKVNDLQGGEILAKPILTDDCQVVIGKGAIIKESYIEKFLELGIKEVEIEDIELNENMRIIYKLRLIDSNFYKDEKESTL